MFLLAAVPYGLLHGFRALLHQLGLLKFNQFLWILVIQPRKAIPGRGMTVLRSPLQQKFHMPKLIYFDAKKQVFYVLAA